MDAALLRTTIVHEANPFFHATGAGEHLERNFGVGNWLIMAIVFVAHALDFEHLTDMSNLNVEVLHLPVGVLISVLAIGRAPVLEDTGVEVNVGAHFMQGSADLVLKVSFDEMNSQESSLWDH